MPLDLSLDNRIMLNTKLDCAIQELDMLFNTTNTELIGKPEYGTNFEQFLWQLTPSTDELRKYIYQKIKCKDGRTTVLFEDNIYPLVFRLTAYVERSRPLWT